MSGLNRDMTEPNKRLTPCPRDISTGNVESYHLSAVSSSVRAHGFPAIGAS